MMLVNEDKKAGGSDESSEQQNKKKSKEEDQIHIEHFAEENKVEDSKALSLDKKLKESAEECSRLKEMVDNLGINFDQCLNDELISDKILNERIDGQRKYSISSTPTIVINEKKLEGSTDYKNIKKKIEKLI